MSCFSKNAQEMYLLIYFIFGYGFCNVHKKIYGTISLKPEKVKNIRFFLIILMSYTIKYK